MMATAYELAQGRERLRALIEFARREGWHVRRAADGRIIFSKQGSAAFYTGAAISARQVAPVVEERCHA